MRLIFLHTHIWISLALLCAPVFVSAEATVTNSVSVSANGADGSRAEVTTIVNGEIIEQWSSTASSSSYQNTSVTHITSPTKPVTEAVTSEDTKTELEILLSRLVALITLYELLLNR